MDDILPWYVEPSATEKAIEADWEREERERQELEERVEDIVSRHFRQLRTPMGFHEIADDDRRYFLRSIEQAIGDAVSEALGL